jgi:hypothetical protein
MRDTADPLASEIKYPNVQESQLQNDPAARTFVSSGPLFIDEKIVREFSRPRNANDHEREGARTSGVTNLIVAVPATEPCGFNIAVRDNMGSPQRFRNRTR